MSFKTATVSVGTNPTLLDVATDTKRWSDSSLLIANEGAADIRVGGSDVTMTGAKRGLLVAAGAERSIDLRGGSRVYGVAAAGTVDVTVAQMGV